MEATTLQDQPVRIVVDGGERRSGVPAALQRFESVELRFDRLPLGDYLVDGRLLFERKTLFDLTVSIRDGRLFRQVQRLVDDPRRAAVILEGTHGDLPSCGMRREAVQGALVSVALMFGLPLVRAADAGETARLLVHAARQLERWDNGPLRRGLRRSRGKRQAQLYLLQGLPGVGAPRAQALVNHFGSIESALTASQHELRGVPGVGPATAARIRWLVS